MCKHVWLGVWVCGWVWGGRGAGCGRRGGRRKQGAGVWLAGDLCGDVAATVPTGRF
jgi:hypothetical protein